MSNNPRNQRFLPDDNLNDDNIDKDRLVVEIPAEPKPPSHERIPSGFDPMGEVYLRGRAFRSLSGGSTPWWILISGWIIFGGFALVILMVLVGSIVSKSFDFGLLILLAFSVVPVFIVWRGTAAKLSNCRNRRR